MTLSRAKPVSMAEFPDHKIFIIRDITYADGTGIRAVDLEPVALVGPDCSGCFEQDLKVYLLDACLGMGKKLLDESISESFASAIFPHVNREDVTPVLRSTSWRHVEARHSDQISAHKGAEDRSTQPMADKPPASPLRPRPLQQNQTSEGASEAPPRESRGRDRNHRQSIVGFPRPPGDAPHAMS